MPRLSFLAALSTSIALLTAPVAEAAVIGSLDGFRTFGDPITGSDYTAMRGDLQVLGHSFSAATRDLTAGYLRDVDAFFHGRPGASVNRTFPQAGELDTLRDWVFDGGVYVLFGGNFRFATDLSRWSSAFGFNYVARDVSGGSWVASSDPLMAGISGGDPLGASGSSWVNFNTTHRDPAGGVVTPSVFATIAGDGATQNAVIGAEYGEGFVLFFGDENPVFGTGRNPGAITLLDNVLDTHASPVPLPAGGVLLVGALGGLVVLRRKSQRSGATH